VTLPVGITSSAVDALRDKIRDLLPEPPAVDAVLVFDGPDPARAFAARAVTVGEPFQEDQEAVAEERVESGARPNVTTRWTVAGSVYVGGGLVSIETHRDAASAILTAIDDGLRADRTLGGAVHLARLGSASWLQGRDDKGAGVAIGFTVELVRLS
jgi:hypothetical protein